MEDEGKSDRQAVSLLSAVADDLGEEAQRLQDVEPLIAKHLRFPQSRRTVPVAFVLCSERRLEWLILSAEGQGPRPLYQKSPGYPYSFRLRLYRSRVLVAPDDSSNRNGPT